MPCDVDAAGEATADAQCEALTSIDHNGIYCGAGFCRQPTRKTGHECTRDTQCISNRCDPVDHLCLETTMP